MEIVLYLSKSYRHGLDFSGVVLDLIKGLGGLVVH